MLERLQQKGIRTVILSGDREEAVADIAKSVGVEDKFVNGSLTPQQKSGVISSLQASGHRVAMVIILWKYGKANVFFGFEVNCVFYELIFLASSCASQNVDLRCVYTE